MADEGRDYDEVLAAAQAAGLRRGRSDRRRRGPRRGEQARDPRPARVRRLARSRPTSSDASADAPGAGRPGITGVTRRRHRRGRDRRRGRSSCIASARRAGPDGADRAPSVLPTAVAADSALGRTDGVLNRIEIEAEPVGTVAFSGPGAGGPATSSAVLGDLIAIARGARQHVGRPAPGGARRAATRCRDDGRRPSAAPGRRWSSATARSCR